MSCLDNPIVEIDRVCVCVLQNPFNWTNKRKYTITLVATFITLCTALNCTSVAIMTTWGPERFGVSREAFVLTFSVLLLAISFTPMVLAPLSEVVSIVSSVCVCHPNRNDGLAVWKEWDLPGHIGSVSQFHLVVETRDHGLTARVQVDATFHSTSDVAVFCWTVDRTLVRELVTGSLL